MKANGSFFGESVALRSGESEGDNSATPTKILQYSLNQRVRGN